jgi:hypothetical protein
MSRKIPTKQIRKAQESRNGEGASKRKERETN